jgi:phosphate uptake regulator
MVRFYFGGMILTMRNFLGYRMAVPAVLLATAASLPAAGQTPQQCQALSLGLNAGVTVQIASLEQIKALSLHEAQVAALILQLAIEKTMSPELKASLETIAGRFRAVKDALDKGSDERIAQISAATDALEAICRH